MEPDTEIRTTVVIPAWDEYARASLQAAVESLNEQTPRFHLLVVDNASAIPLPDLGAAEVIHSVERLSLGRARNLGLVHVKTPYVIFWDADDLMLAGALEVLERAIAEDEELVVFGMAICESPSGQRHRWPRRYLRTLAALPHALIALHCIWSQFPTTGATIIRTEAARTGGGFADADSGEDWCLGVSLAARGRIGWTERFGRVYRMHPESMWARHLTVSHQRRHAAAVRQRIRDDRRIPAWVRVALPVIWLGQYLALGAHAAMVALRGRAWGSGR